ncbi:MAG: phosphohistidine phosphatase SixA [Candidatus Latescibacteria bacterium]|jgi:phosphohistidine phosphatase|nr:phosphohistidine phosphatase SixA [Candidatus Latescibacterota bacterium]
MAVYLVRHAEAKHEDEDPERPLSDTGWEEARKVAAFISQIRGLRAQRILHSGKARARQTAEVLAEVLQPAEGVEETDGLDPNADPFIWANHLGDTEENIVLVGHLPHMGRLAGLLVTGKPDREAVQFQSGALVCLDQQEAENWTVQWMVVPRVLPAADD